MSPTTQHKLARLVKRFLDLIWFLIIFSMFAWPIAATVIGLSIPDDPQQRHTDIEMFAGFKVFPDEPSGLAAAPNSAPEYVLQGNGMVRLNNTSSRLAWYLSTAITEVMGFIFLFGLAQMRHVFASVLKGESFARENAGRIRKIGYVFLGWHIIYPLLQFFGGQIMLNDIAFNVQGVVLYSSFQFNVVGLFAGFAIIVLAGVLREAADIHQEQALTV